MQIGHFYFILDSYYKKYPNPHYMNDHAVLERQPHGRPCMCAFTENDRIFWMIPISSKVKKFQDLHKEKVQHCGKCDTIDFCKILGHPKAALIQNMFPITEEYIKNEYMDIGGEVRIPQKDEKRLIRKAKKILLLQRKGFNLIFGGVLEIEQQIKSDYSL